MNDKPLVSLAILTYNHGNYIKDCLLSILEQNYKNIEVFILDDASQDDTVVIVESYLKALKERFEHVFFIKNKKNKGNIPFNMNCMLKRSRGLYCKMLSGDDILEYNCISKLVEGLINNPQCSVIYSNGFIIPDNYKKGTWVEKTKNLYSYRRSEVESEDFFRKLMFGDHIAAPTVMIKRQLLETYGFLDESMAYEDYEYWLRLSFRKEKFYFLNEYLVYYRKSVSSISNFKNGKKISKIKIGINSDGKTHKKYLRYLSKDEQLQCLEYYYYKYLKICWEERYWRGVVAIIYKLKRKNIKISWDFLKTPSRTQYMQNGERGKIVIKLLEKWISNTQDGMQIVDYFREKSLKSIGIYGLGCIANLLCEELNNTEIEIKYIIDRNADRLLSDMRLTTLDGELGEVDAIVVIPAGQYDMIKKQLQEKVTCPIIHIEDILFYEW